MKNFGSWRLSKDKRQVNYLCKDIGLLHLSAALPPGTAPIGGRVATL